MANTQKYALGVGQVYISLGTTVPATDEEIETTDNLIGSTSGGCTLAYNMESYDVIDDANKKVDSFKIGEEVKFSGNILSWNLDILARLSANSVVTTGDTKDTLKLGSANNSIQKVVVRFVHTFSDGKKMRVTLVGNSSAGFEMEFTKDKETVIPFEISALNQEDGSLCIIEIEK